MRKNGPWRDQFCPHRRTGCLPNPGLIRDLPERSRSLALVLGTLSSSAGRLGDVPQILLCPARTATISVPGGFVKNRERVLKV